MKMIKLCIVLFVALSLGFFVAPRGAEACCGQLIDIWQYTVSPDIIDPCAGETANFSGSIYEYYWADRLDQWPMVVTITINDGDGNTVRTMTATVTKTGGGGSYGVDDDGDGSIDEDSGYPVAGVDDDGDGRIDEDGGYPGDEYADFTFSAAWDGRDDGGDIAPIGTYDATITAQAGQMGSATVYATVVTTTEEPCCVEGGSVDIDPDTINKERAGKWITGHVTAPPGYTSADVTAGRVISIASTEVDIPGDVKSPDEEGAVLKFSSADVIANLPDVPGGAAGHGMPGRVEDVEICIEVTLADGSVSCALCDTVDVVQEGGGM